MEFVVPVTGDWTSIYQFADNLNLTYNELSSLHVAFACTLALVFGKNLGMFGRFIFAVWAFSVFLSTLFIHQHHILSALAGVLLFYFVIHFQGKQLLQS